MKSFIIATLLVSFTFTDFKHVVDSRLNFANRKEIRAVSILKDSCKWNNINLYGKVKIVNSFPDIKIKFVSSFPDIKVRFVDSFPDDCGKWQIVDSFPDFTVQVVESFPDLKIQQVESFNGMVN